MVELNTVEVMTSPERYTCKSKYTYEMQEEPDGSADILYLLGEVFLGLLSLSGVFNMPM